MRTIMGSVADELHGQYAVLTEVRDMLERLRRCAGSERSKGLVAAAVMRTEDVMGLIRQAIAEESGNGEA